MLLRLLTVGLALCSVTFLLTVAWKVEHGSGGMETVLAEARGLGARARVRLEAASAAAKVSLTEVEGVKFLEAFGEEGWLPEESVRSSRDKKEPSMSTNAGRRSAPTTTTATTRFAPTTTTTTTAATATATSKKAPQRREGPPSSAPHPDCFASLDEVPAEALHPRKGSRHMVDPPASSTVLVCCATTKGALNIAVHPEWAPLGAGRFLAMVLDAYFSATVPMFRCLAGFICQFGLSGDPVVTRRWHRSIRDDPSWLPLGPDFRKNADGVKRFAVGYMAYAGGGAHSRGNQFIVALGDQERLCGGSPWEVPWGEVVGDASFETLAGLHTGYGDDGPSQDRLTNRGVTDELKADFPKLDYITACDVVDNSSKATPRRRRRL